MPEASIFLVEDEALIRMMLAEMVEELGHRVVAEAGDMVAGQALAETAIFDLAILDINIAGDMITPIAEIIDRRGLPFLSGESETHPIEKVLGFTEEMVDAKQKPIPNSSEAIRRLVELGLRTKK
jgi:CheY-like chemotaxis protein